MKDELSKLGNLGVALYPDITVGRYFAIGQIAPAVIA
jgi:hypothetical protein